MILTETKYYSGETGTESFYVPTFSEIKKIYIMNNIIHMVLEYPDDITDSSKIINLKIQKDYLPSNEPFYKYFDTQLINKPELVNSCYGNNIQFIIDNITETYHFFIQEIKHTQEIREEKINDIIS